MVLKNADTLRQLHIEAGWRPGDDPAPIYRQFVARMRDIVANEDATAHQRTRAHDDLLQVVRAGLAT